MKKLFTVLLICICALLCACDEVVPAETTKAETTLQTTIEVPVETTTQEQKVELYDYNFTIERITTPFDWCYSFDVDPKEHSVSFQSPEVWKITKESAKVNENAFYALGDNSVLLTFYKVWDSEKILSNEVFPLATDNGKIYNLVKYSYDEYEHYNYSVPLSDNLTTVFSIEGNLDEDAANKYANPIIDSIEFNGTDIYSEVFEPQEAISEFTEVNLSTYFGFSVADYGNPVMQSSAPFKLFASLPASWEFYDSKSSTVNEKVYAENAPIDSIYKNSEHFAYSSIKPLFCYILNGELTQEWVAGIGVPHLYQNYKTVYEGTANGRKYIVYYNDIHSYHAKEYLCYAEFEFNSQKYVFEFKAYADTDNAELIEKVIDSIRLVTEPSTEEKLGTVLNSLWWVRNYYYKNGTPVVKLSISTPDGWETTGTDFRSSSDDSLLSFSYELYETGGAIPLSELSGSRIQYVELIDTVDEPDLFAEIYLHSSPELFNFGYKYLTTGYISLDDRYAISFWLHSDSNDISKIEPFLNAVTVTESPETPLIDTADVKILEETKSVKIGNLFCVNHRTMYESDGEYLPESSYIELDLPASWELLGKDSIMTDAIYSEFGVPGTSLSPEKCLYQGFASDTLYTKDVASLGEIEGVTDSGNKYWFTKQTYDYYHAVEYYVAVQVSEEYIYSFTLCVDKDNTELVEQVINSVALVYAPSYTLEYAMSLAEQIVTFALTEDWLVESYSPTYLDIFRFLVSTGIYQNNDMHPYGNIVSVSDNSQNLQISYLDAEKMICEVFGEQKLMDSKYLSDIYDAETASYLVPRGIGLWTSAYSFEVTNTTFEGEHVCIRGVLKNSNSYEYDESSFGEVEITFECLGNNNSFLRFLNIKLL